MSESTCSALGEQMRSGIGNSVCSDNHTLSVTNAEMYLVECYGEIDR